MTSKIIQQINELKNYFPDKNSKNAKVSKVTVGWQIDHSFRVMIVVCAAVKKSNPTDFQKKFNAMKLAIFTTGIIPRGKAKAPTKVMTNQENFEDAELLVLMEKAEQKLGELMQLDNNAFFAHPYFGDLNKKEAIKFIEIHTEHHLKIIRDILK